MPADGYVILHKAAQDIEEIAGYLRHELNSSKAAADFIDALHRKIKTVVSFPEMHPVVSFRELVLNGYRSFSVKRFVALYKIMGNLIVIAHVFHQSQDYARLVLEYDRAEN